MKFTVAALCLAFTFAEGLQIPAFVFTSARPISHLVPHHRLAIDTARAFNPSNRNRCAKFQVRFLFCAHGEYLDFKPQNFHES